MFDAITKMGRPFALGAAGAAAGYFLGKSKKQRNSLALGYGAVGALVGYATQKQEKEEVQEAVQAVEEAQAEAAANAGFYGAAAAQSQASPSMNVSFSPAAGTTANIKKRNFRVLHGRYQQPYRRLVQKIPSYRMAQMKAITPKRIIRSRATQAYRRLYYPRPSHWNAMRPYAPRITQNYYQNQPGWSVRRGRNYYGPATTQACQMLAQKIIRLQSRIAAGKAVYKRPGVPLSELEAPIYLQKLRQAYQMYCGQLYGNR